MRPVRRPMFAQHRRSDGEPLLLLAAGDVLLPHREVGPLLLELLAQRVRSAPAGADPLRERLAGLPRLRRRLRDGVAEDGDDELVVEPLAQRLLDPLGPGGGEPRRQVEVAQAGRRVGDHGRLVHLDGLGLEGVGRRRARERPRAHADRLVRSLVAHGVLHQQVRRPDVAGALRQVQVAQGRRQHGRAGRGRLRLRGGGRGRGAGLRLREPRDLLPRERAAEVRHRPARLEEARLPGGGRRGGGRPASSCPRAASPRPSARARLPAAPPRAAPGPAVSGASPPSRCPCWRGPCSRGPPGSGWRGRCRHPAPAPA